jgi:hypothetical protein
MVYRMAVKGHGIGEFIWYNRGFTGESGHTVKPITIGAKVVTHAGYLFL